MLHIYNQYLNILQIHKDDIIGIIDHSGNEIGLDVKLNVSDSSEHPYKTVEFRTSLVLETNVEMLVKREQLSVYRSVEVIRITTAKDFRRRYTTALQLAENRKAKFIKRAKKENATYLVRDLERCNPLEQKEILNVLILECENIEGLTAGSSIK